GGRAALVVAGVPEPVAAVGLAEDPAAFADLRVPGVAAGPLEQGILGDRLPSDDPVGERPRLLPRDRRRPRRQDDGPEPDDPDDRPPHGPAPQPVIVPSRPTRPP